MKEKFSQALKAAIADTKNGITSVHDKTVTAYVDVFGTQITDESKIADEVTKCIGLLKETQQNINSVTAKAVSDKETIHKAEIEKLKAQITPPAKTTPPDEMEAKIKAAVEQVVKPLQEKIQGYEAKETEAQRKNTITSKAKELGLTDEDMKYVNVPAETDVSEFLTGYKQSLISRGLKPAEGEGSKTPDAKTQTDFAASMLDRIAVKSE